MRALVGANENALAKDNIALHELRLRCHFDFLTDISGADLNECAARVVAYYGKAHNSDSWMVRRMSERVQLQCTARGWTIRNDEVHAIFSYCHEAYTEADEHGRTRYFEFLKSQYHERLDITSGLFNLLSLPIVERETAHRNSSIHPRYYINGSDSYQRIEFPRPGQVCLMLQSSVYLVQLPNLHDQTLYLCVSKLKFLVLALESACGKVHLSPLQQAALAGDLYIW